MYKLEDGYRIYARWPKSVSRSSPDWEPWSQVFTNTADAKQAHERLTSKGAGKYYYFGLFSRVDGKPPRLIRILSKPNKGENRNEKGDKVSITKLIECLREREKKGE